MARNQIITRCDRGMGSDILQSELAHRAWKNVMTTISRELTGEELAPRPTYRQIVVPLDGSPLAETVLPFVETLACAFGSEITIVCAHPRVESTFTGELALSGGGMGGAALEQLYATDEAVAHEDVFYLARMRERLARRDLVIHTSVPRMRPAEAIVSVARQTGADLIAMTTHGRSGLGRALLGSVADGVLRTAPCPVLLVHPQNGVESGHARSLS